MCSKDNPEIITWSNRTTEDLTVTASSKAESGQMIMLQTSTTYEVYFTALSMEFLETLQYKTPTVFIRQMLGEKPG